MLQEVVPHPSYIHICRVSFSGHILFEVQINWPRPILITINNCRQDWEWHTMADMCRARESRLGAPSGEELGGVMASLWAFFFLTQNWRWCQVMSGWFLKPKKNHPEISAGIWQIWQAHGTGSMNFFLTHGLDMPGPYEQLGPREMDTRWPLPKRGSCYWGARVAPNTSAALQIQI